MKRSKNLFASDKCPLVETPKSASAGGILKSVLVIFMISWITILSSCAVAVRTPRYDRSGVIIERHDRGVRHHRGMRHHHDERRDRHHRDNRNN